MSSLLQPLEPPLCSSLCFESFTLLFPWAWGISPVPLLEGLVCLRDVPAGCICLGTVVTSDGAAGEEQVSSPGAAPSGRVSDVLTLHCSTFLFTSSSSSFKVSSLLAAEDAPGPATVPVMLLELLAAWFSLWGGREEAHPQPQCQGRVGRVCRRGIWIARGMTSHSATLQWFSWASTSHFPHPEEDAATPRGQDREQSAASNTQGLQDPSQAPLLRSCLLSSLQDRGRAVWK